MFIKALNYLWLMAKCQTASRYAARRGLPGMQFNRFGRQIGWSLLKGGSRRALKYLMTPVFNIRYFELPFALACLPSEAGRWLDVSSPSLLTLYLAKTMPKSRLELLNPDKRDVEETMYTASRMGIANLAAEPRGVEVLANRLETYDCIWSISVVEHIAGDYDDSQAMKWMYGALNKGGRLIVTVPVDRRAWDEFRELDHYGTQPYVDGKGYFFQHFYDEGTLYSHLIQPLGVEPTRMQWYGEAMQGRFADYIRRWQQRGYACTANDPREMVDNYRMYSKWAEMPGFGVCGFMLEKPSV